MASMLARISAMVVVVVILICAACTQTPAASPDDSAAEQGTRPTVTGLIERTEATAVTEAVGPTPDIADCEIATEGLTAASWTLEAGPDDAPLAPVGLIDVSVWESATCTTITITFGDNDGPIATVPGGIEVVSSATESRLTFPPSIDLLTLAPARRAFWPDGFAVPVLDGTEHFMLIRDGSGAIPVIEASADPAQLAIHFPTGDSQVVVTLADSFVIDELSEVEPGRLQVSGFGAAFEAHAGVGVVDADGAWVLDGWRVEGGTSAGEASVRMGNPGVAWAPFSFDLVGLAAGDYSLYLDSCGGQCDVETVPDTLPFTVSSD